MQMSDTSISSIHSSCFLHNFGSDWIVCEFELSLNKFSVITMIKTASKKSKSKNVAENNDDLENNEFQAELR